MGGVWKSIPYTYVLMIIGTLALTGFPFLSGFYSKDAIIEYAYLKQSGLGYWASTIGIFTAFLTSIYSWRLIFKTFHGGFNNRVTDIKSVHESPIVMLLPLFILALGSIGVGFIFKEILIGNDSSIHFWKDSIIFLEPLSNEHPPTWFLFLTPFLVIISIPISYYLFIKNKNILIEIVDMNRPFYDFLKNKWYFDEIYDSILVKPAKNIGLFFWKKIDVNTIDRLGPDGISKIIKFFSIKAVKFQTGYVYQYAFVMLIGFTLILTLFILK